MKYTYCILVTLLFVACNSDLSERAKESSVLKEKVIDQAFADSMARVKAYNDSIYFAGPQVSIETTMGTMVFKLYNKTPKHKNNFLKLARSNYYKGLKFHRVLKNFMIQGGDPNSRDNDPRDDGLGGPGYTIPAEFVPRLIHKRGALCAAREGDAVNPKRASSGSQFYIVDGTKFRENDEVFYQFNTPKEDIAIYSTVGGTPRLDRSYTVFGEIIRGFDVMESIAGTRTIVNPLRPEAPPSVPETPVVILKVNILEAEAKPEEVIINSAPNEEN